MKNSDELMSDGYNPSVEILYLALKMQFSTFV